MLTRPLLSHSRLGITSFILCFAALAIFWLILIIKGISEFITLISLIMAIILIAIIWLFTFGYLRPSLADLGFKKFVFVEPWMLILPGLFLVIALGLGIAGLIQNETKKMSLLYWAAYYLLVVY